MSALVAQRLLHHIDLLYFLHAHKTAKLETCINLCSGSLVKPEYYTPRAILCGFHGINDYMFSRNCEKSSLITRVTNMWLTRRMVSHTKRDIELVALANNSTSNVISPVGIAAKQTMITRVEPW